VDKKALSERDICSKFITPALVRAGWNLQTQIREEFSLTKGRIIVRGKLHSRGASQRADYVLFYKPGIPLAVLEAKDNRHSVGAGMQQALGYAGLLDVPFVFSSNGDAVLFHDKLAQKGSVEQEISLEDFPSPQELWERWMQHKELAPEQQAVITEDYYSDGSNKTPRYYQLQAINKTLEAVSRG